MKEGSSSKKRFGLWILIGIVAVILLFFLSIPTILSSHAGTQYLVSIAEKKTGGRLSIEELSLGWFTDQEIEKLNFTDKGGGTIQFDRLTSTVSFWNLIFRSGSIGTTRIENPRVTIPSDVQVKTPSEKKEKAKAKKAKAPFWDRLKGHLIVTNGSIQMLQGIELDVVMPNHKKISVVLNM